jgi:hypothetical protein
MAMAMVTESLVAEASETDRRGECDATLRLSFFLQLSIVGTIKRVPIDGGFGNDILQKRYRCTYSLFGTSHILQMFIDYVPQHV